MSKIWILVCDAARARLFEVQDGDPTWRAVDTFDHPESRSKASALVGDHSGQRSSEGPSVHHNALAPSSSPKDIEKGRFGHSLAKMLDQAMRSKRFDRWVLVAPPHFLGMLRNELSHELEKQLMATVDKNLNHLDVRALAQRLRNTVGLAPDTRDIARKPDKHAP
jgi:protein required for attachment to host cells